MVILKMGRVVILMRREGAHIEEVEGAHIEEGEGGYINEGEGAHIEEGGYIEECVSDRIYLIPLYQFLSCSVAVAYHSTVTPWVLSIIYGGCVCVNGGCVCVNGGGSV